MKFNSVTKICCVLGVFIMASSAQAEDFIEKAGDVTQVLNPVIAVSMSYYKDDYAGIIQLGKSSLLNLAMTYSLKIGLNDVDIQGERLGKRPNGSDNNFPSGHTSSAFSAAWYIHKRYGYNLKYSGVPLVLAIFTGYSRVHADQHDLKAVFAGAIVGILAVELLTETIKYDNTIVYLSVDSGNDLTLNISRRF